MTVTRTPNILVMPERYMDRHSQIPSFVMVNLDFMAYQCEDKDEFYVKKNRVQPNWEQYVDGDTVRADIDNIHRDHETDD